MGCAKSYSLEGVDSYVHFVEAKIPVSQAYGVEVEPAEVSFALRPLARDIVVAAAWAGRCGVFSPFGMHKAETDFELAREATADDSAEGVA